MPHAIPPLAVHPRDLPRDPHEPCAVMSVHELLADPPGAGAEAAAGFLRRLLAARACPVAVGVTGPARDRLEAAGWLVTHEGSDLEAARAAAWPAAPAYEAQGLEVLGSLAPRIVLVLDRAQAGRPAVDGQSAAFLLRALRSIGVDELSVAITSARTTSGTPRTDALQELDRAVARYEPRWVALGRKAEVELRRAGITAGFAPAPGWASRWRAGEGPEGYARSLVEAGVPDGEPFSGYAPPADQLPELPPPYDVATRVGRPPARDREGGSADPAKLGAARAAYVSGEASTLADAARMVGLHVQRVYEVSRVENWRGQRDEEIRRRTAEAIEAARREEGQRWASCRRKAWKSLEKAYDRYLDRVSKPGEKVTAFEVESLSRSALALSGAELDGATRGQGEEERLSGDELARRMAELVNGLGGPEETA